MGANNTAQVLSGRPNVAGAVFSFPVGAEIPEDATTALPTQDQRALGYVSEDGLTNSYTRDSEQIREWGGKIVRVLQTDVTDTWSLALIQSGDPDVLAEVFGEENVVVTPADSGSGMGELITVKRNGAPLPPRCFVFEMFDAGRARRVKLGNAQITENEDIAYQRGAAVQYGITITAYPDEAGNSSVEYIEEVVAAA